MDNERFSFIQSVKSHAPPHPSVVQDSPRKYEGDLLSIPVMMSRRRFLDLEQIFQHFIQIRLEGDAAMINGNYVKARSIYLQMYDDSYQAQMSTYHFPESMIASIYCHCGIAQLQLGEYEASIQSCEHALHLESTWVLPFYCKAWAYYQVGRFEDANRIFVHIIQNHRVEVECPNRFWMKPKKRSFPLQMSSRISMKDLHEITSLSYAGHQINFLNSDEWRIIETRGSGTPVIRYQNVLTLELRKDPPDDSSILQQSSTTKITTNRMRHLSINHHVVDRSSIVPTSST